MYVKLISLFYSASRVKEEKDAVGRKTVLFA
jgi:hypothetical protein